MKMGFFGGCFNPPTIVHIDIAKGLVKEKIVDKVVFVPVGDFYKKQNLAPATKRGKMIELAIGTSPNLLIDDFEIKTEKSFVAKDVFEIITEKYQNNDIFFIMGSDNFLKMNTWENYDEIINKYRYIVVTRTNFEAQSTKENVIILNPKKQYNFDSTTVRRLIKENKHITNLIDLKVYDYIKKNNLYVS